MISEKGETLDVFGFFVAALTVLFIGLKLTGYIDWSWWWVFAPLWVPFVAVVLTLAFVAIVAGIVNAVSSR